MPEAPIDIGRPHALARRLGRKGWALVRTVVLLALTGLFVAGVIATAFGGLLIAIDGRLP